MNEPRDIPGVIAPPPLIALATLLFGLALDWLWPAYVLTVLLSFWTRIIIGVPLIAIGLAIAVMARRSFVQAGTNVQPWKPSLTLVTGGVFAWMRNPMYLGLGLLTAGVAIMLASGWTLVLMVPAALVLHYGVVLREERYLESKFGDKYRRYRESVPRYGWQIPGTR
jgi:protein-S-isoprenylcysteine O-methyltransferase Ste14